MAEQQLAEELEEFEEFEETSEDEETSEQDSETLDWEDETQKQKQSVNGFKKLREEIKTLKKALKEKNDKSEVRLKPDQELDARFFFIENPEAKDLKDDIKATIARFPWMSFEEAFTYLKATKPKPSETKKDFSFNTKTKPADIMNMSDDEASEKLSPSEYLKYTRAKGSNFLKPNLLRK